MVTDSALEILAFDPTPLGLLCLRRRPLLCAPGTVVTEVTLNHHFLMSSYNTDSERALSTLALEMAGGDALKLLVGGLGLGYTAAAALASNSVAKVEALELLPQVIDWLDRDLFPLASTLKGDNRFSVTQGDVYALLAGPPERTWDLILIDVHHAPDAPLTSANLPFYTQRGLQAAKEHLLPGGILAVWAAEENAAFADTLRAVFSEVRVVPVTFTNLLIDQELTNWIFLAR